MSSFWLLHLSDIHFSEEVNPVESMVEAIADSVISHRFSDSQGQPNTIILAVTGDVADTGAAAEYARASALFTDLEGRLRGHFQRVISVVAPGNHDLNHRAVGSVRASVMRGYDGEAVDSDYFAEVAKPQRDFWSFAAATFPGAPREPSLGYDRVVDVDSRDVVLRCVNSSWCSSVGEEPGTLVYSDRLARAHFEAPDDSQLVITLFHHPFRWIVEEHYRDFRATIEGWSDLILTGHEHVQSARESRAPQGVQKLYVEGGALQYRDVGIAGSSFSIIEVDVPGESYSLVSKILMGDGYVTAETSGRNHMAGFRRRARADFPLSLEAYQWADDIGDIFRHPRRPILKLSDVFVSPEITKAALGQRAMKVPEVVDDLLVEITKENRCLILGSELSGKTTLLRSLHKRAFAEGGLPLYLDGEEIGRNGLPNAMSLAIAWQYPQAVEEPAAGRFRAELKKCGLALVDNLDAIRKTSTQDAVLQQLEREFVSVAVTGSSALTLPLNVRTTAPRVWSYAQVEVAELSHVKRGEIIEHWVRLGQDDDDPEALARQITYRDGLLSRFIRANLLPASPYYVLLVLQQLESQVSEAEANASYGFLYETMLTTAMSASKRLAAETKYDYIAAFAGLLRERLGRPIQSQDELLVSEDVFRGWHKNHWSELGVSISLDDARCDLVAARIFVEREGYIGFRFRNSYYYGVARWLHDQYPDDLRTHVEALVENLYLDENYVILMFLAHLDRQALVLDALLGAARRLLADNKGGCILAGGGKLLTDLGHLPRLELPAGTFQQKRQALLAEMDGRDADLAPPAQAPDEPEPMLGNMSAALRVVQAMGQILRRRGASPALTGERKSDTVRECYELSLRLLNRFYEMIDAELEGFRHAFLYAVVSRDGGRISDPNELRAAVSSAIASLVVALTVSIVRSVGDAVGTHLLAPTIENVVAQAGENFSYSAIDLAIALDINPRMPTDRIQKAVDLARSEQLGQAVVARLTWSAMRRYQYAPLELRNGCRIAGIGNPTALLVDPTKKRSR